MTRGLKPATTFGLKHFGRYVVAGFSPRYRLKSKIDDTWTVGIRLDPYVLVSPIGAGGMGEVWKAGDTRLARVVAIKRLKGEHSSRFKREARAIAALNHPHICQLYDIGPDYLVLCKNSNRVKSSGK